MEVKLTSDRIQQAIRGIAATIRANGPKGRQAQTYRGHKAWQGLDLDRQTWR